jgi:hypothetical protein
MAYGPIGPPQHFVLIERKEAFRLAIQLIKAREQLSVRDRKSDLHLTQEGEAYKMDKMNQEAIQVALDPEDAVLTLLDETALAAVGGGIADVIFV